MRALRSTLRILPALMLGLAAACDDAVLNDPSLRAPGESDPRFIRAGKDSLPGRYIVVLRRSEVGTAAATAQQMVQSHGGELFYTYETALKGFAARLSPQAVEALMHNPMVDYIAQDGRVSIRTTQSEATWGLDRIDQRDMPLNSLYNYAATGTGVRAYILDTGIRTSHVEFGGRASVGFDAIPDSMFGQDCNGHGTHVAGTVGGAVYGVAKNVSLVAVRVLDCSGNGSFSQVIAGVDWVTANAVHPAVANMSLSGGSHAPLNDAVAASIASGVTYAVAAGNSNLDACNYSPANLPGAITVGSSTSTDSRSTFSNYGSCVDLFAPGTAITSAWYLADDELHTIDGTSMASPHVAGVIARYLQSNPTATPAAVTSAILGSATTAHLTDVGAGSPNRLLYMGGPAAVFALHPGSLSFTAVRYDTPAPASASRLSGTPRFTASGSGTPGSARAQRVGAQAVVTPGALADSLVLENLAATARAYVVSSNRSWLDVAPPGGTLPIGGFSQVNVGIDLDSLTAGVHGGSVTVSGGGASTSVPVTANVVQGVVLSSGIPVTGIAGDYNEFRFFAIDAPLGAESLTIRTTGGTGDSDLHVRYGQQPTLTEYNCRPYMSGNEETCVIPSPPAGRYYIVLHAYTDFTGVTLEAFFGGAYPPLAPEWAGASIASATTANVNWVDSSYNETHFEVARRTKAPGGSYGPYTNLANRPANTTAMVDSGLVAGNTYQWRVRACNGFGCSPWVLTNAVLLAVIPAAPSAPVGTIVTATRIQVRWNDLSSDETRFELARRMRNLDGTYTAYTALPNPPANATGYADLGVTTTNVYQYRVRSCNAAGCSAWILGPLVVLPSAPGNMTATPATPTRINLHWSDYSNNETGFEVARRLRNLDGTWGAYASFPLTAANVTGYADLTALAGRTYGYRVRACNASGCSGWATSPSATTPGS